MRVFDLRNAYVTAKLNRPVYMTPPQGYEREGKVLQLHKVLPASGRAFYKSFDRYMRSVDFKPSKVDPCLYVHKSRQLLLLSYVDDCVLLGAQGFVDAAFARISADYSVRDLGFPADLLGMQLERSGKLLTIRCERMIDNMLTRFNIAPKLVTTPMASDAMLSGHDFADSKPDSTLYRQQVGCINWIATHVRPDIAHCAHSLSRHLNAPSYAHLSAATRCIQYLHATRRLGISYSSNADHPISTFADSDWAGCIDTRQSTSGRVTMMQGAAVMWTSARQRSIALSSAEAEMVAASDAARDVRYIRRLLASIAQPIPHPTPLYVDNASALQWANKKAKWSASRHIATRHFCLQEWKRAGHILPIKVDTTRQLADIMTKALPHGLFAVMRAQITNYRDSVYDLREPLTAARRADAPPAA